ncbi:Fmu (Sun) domain protein [Ignicoccus hospitalis KIN4/I]|uniref:Fmu (Sun) domain protein n=1 Tax=Ignicoccus hospitalis (strain KIN4/I / DSM 18386 / JCM 14125) TaxID=453591 RepID=A8AC55_IGNH4|nr:Fmu (Sun) domain protein [Ignicoccus hospitalis KIN4/I]
MSYWGPYTVARRLSERPVPLEVIAARALARASKGYSLKGYLEKAYKKYKLPDPVRPALVGMISDVARRWMLLSRALGLSYERPKASFDYWFKVVIAYQALFRKVKPGKLWWAFKRFPRDLYEELLKAGPEDYLAGLGGEERERVYRSVAKWAWEELKKFTDPKEFVDALDHPEGFWVRIRDPGAVPELKRLYEVEEGPFDDSLYLRGPKRLVLKSGLHPKKVVIMELASMSVAHLAKGVRALDLTAAPGGKSLHLSDRGFIVISNDLDPRRFAFDVEKVVSDARLPAFRKAFDTVVLDPDCSGIGRLGSPETRILLPFINKNKMSEYQRELIKGMLSLAKRGTRLIYTTCTITYEENEAHSELFEEVAEPVEVEVGAPRGRRGWRWFLPQLHKTIGFTLGVFEVG